MSAVLGGREAVVDIPASEALKFMELALEKDRRAAEKERERYWMNFLVSMFSQQPQGEESPERVAARKKFIDAIKPTEQAAPKKQYGWDNIPEEVLKEYQAAPLRIGKEEE